MGTRRYSSNRNSESNCQQGRNNPVKKYSGIMLKYINSNLTLLGRKLNDRLLTLEEFKIIAKYKSVFSVGGAPDKRGTVQEYKYNPCTASQRLQIKT